MPKVQWDEAYTVHVQGMDDQHKRLLEIINDLHEALMAEDRDDLADAKEKAIKSLEVYLIEHFSKEEEYMLSIGYPGLDQHQKEHQNFLQRVEKHKDGLRSIDGLLPTEVMKILVTWLHDHLLGEDQKYSQFAISK